ncbi:hypothetical protein [Lysobacter brunescens]|uniref:Uncharacterized protein n=1 Tax=Lysobacter brunescens TaxID=262323 RepID=A0ABW2Y9F8_9GAMM
MKNIAAVLVLSLTALAAGTSRAQSTEESYSISEELMTSLKPHIGNGPVLPMPAAMSSTQTIWNKGNFGMKVYYDEKIRYRMLENRLHHVEGTGGFRKGQAGGSGTSLSLCGLLPLVSVSQSSTTNKGFISVVGIGIHTSSTVAFANRSRMIRLETTAPSLCGITPGQHFTYRVDAESTRRVEGDYIRDRTIEEVVNGPLVTCTARQDILPASSIAPQLVGDYIPVECVTQDAKNRPSSTHLAYLASYRFYLVMANKSKWQRSEHAHVVEPAAPDSTSSPPPP